MSNWTRSEIIALCSLIVAIIVALADSEVRCFLRLQSESCSNLQITQTSPGETNQKSEQPKSSSSPPISTIEPSPSTTAEPDINLISNETGVDYTLLRNLLAERKWKEADQETSRAMRQAVGREKEYFRRFYQREMRGFSCEDLRIIDQLWMYYSDGKFGFTVQEYIFKNLGYDDYYGNSDALDDFATQVGWRQKDNWLDYSDLTFNQNSPKGQFPTTVSDTLPKITFGEGRIKSVGPSLRQEFWGVEVGLNLFSFICLAVGKISWKLYGIRFSTDDMVDRKSLCISA